MTLALEPEAAGTLFARTLTEPATVLIGDFGGGTSDFSVMRFDPRAGSTPLGHAGIGIAGDVFDYRIIDRAIAPLLGKGDTYRIMGKPLPVPPEYYSGFARWHRLSLMRTPRTLRAIAEVARTAQHPERLHHLIALIEDGLGYALYQAVSTAKAELSQRRDHHAPLPPQGLRRRTPRHARRVRRAGSPPTSPASPPRSIRCWRRPTCRRTQVDRVFLTGGTAFVPAVRRLFETRFGAAQAGRRRRVRLGGRGPCADRPARLVSRPHTDHQEPPMATERTLSIIKPDATRRNLTGQINAALETAGLRIVAQRRVRLTQAQAEAFYAVHKERPFFRGLVEFMISGPVVAQVLEGDNAVARNREVMGATDPKKAAPGTIRALFAEDIEANSVHGSDSAENAAIEIGFFFAQVDIVG